MKATSTSGTHVLPTLTARNQILQIVTDMDVCREHLKGMDTFDLRQFLKVTEVTWSQAG